MSLITVRLLQAADTRAKDIDDTPTKEECISVSNSSNLMYWFDNGTDKELARISIVPDDISGLILKQIHKFGSIKKLASLNLHTFHLQAVDGSRSGAEKVSSRCATTINDQYHPYTNHQKHQLVESELDPVWRSMTSLGPEAYDKQATDVNALYEVRKTHMMSMKQKYYPDDLHIVG